MKQVPNSAFKIARLPAEATIVDIIKQINPNVGSMKDVRRHCAATLPLGTRGQKTVGTL